MYIAFFCQNSTTLTEDDQGDKNNDIDRKTEDNSKTDTCNEPKHLSKKKKRRNEDLSDIASGCLNELRRMSQEDNNENEKKTDIYDKYGEQIASEMRNLPNEIVKQVVKIEIQNVFLKAHTGYYTAHMNPNAMNVTRMTSPIHNLCSIGIRTSNLGQSTDNEIGYNCNESWQEMRSTKGGFQQSSTPTDIGNSICSGSALSFSQDLYEAWNCRL